VYWVAELRVTSTLASPCSELGRVRNNDLFRVNLHLTFTFNNLTAHGIPPKHLYLRVSRLNFG